MPRISLDLTIEQRRQLKTLASYVGLSMKDFILSRIFSEPAPQNKFPTYKKPKATLKQLQKAQELFFDKAEIIIASPEKWEKLYKQVSADG